MITLKKMLRRLACIVINTPLILFFISLKMLFIRYTDGNYGNRIRYRYYKKRLKYLGKNAIIDTGVFISGAEYISIGDNTHIDKNCILVGSSANLDLSYRYVKTRG